MTNCKRFLDSQIVITTNIVVVSSVGIKTVVCIPLMKSIQESDFELG